MLIGSTTTFHKYFPDQTLPETAPSPPETPQDLYHHPCFSIARLASEILRPSSTNPRKAGQVVEPGLSLKSNTGTSRTTTILRFPRITSLRNLGVAVDDGYDAVDPEGLPSGDAGEAKRKTSWKDMPKFLLAGAVSTVISRTCVAPLERIKLECIVQGSKHTWVKIVRWIWVSEGLRGFWKGNTLNLFRMVPFKSINFICYDMYLARLLCAQEKREITNHDRLIGGGISGVTATVICMPLDTIRTRLTAQGGEALGGVTGCVHHMIRNEGFLSLYKGLTPTLISIGPSSAVFYAVYDILKASHLSSRAKHKRISSTADLRGDRQIGAARTLIYGAIAGACAETVTYPLEVVRRQLQLQRSIHHGLGSVFVNLVQKDGLGSLFSGLFPSTLQVLPSAAFSYYFYEMMKSVLKIS